MSTFVGILMNESENSNRKVPVNHFSDSVKVFRRSDSFNLPDIEPIDEGVDKELEALLEEEYVQNYIDVHGKPPKKDKSGKGKEFFSNLMDSLFKSDAPTESDKVDKPTPENTGKNPEKNPKSNIWIYVGVGAGILFVGGLIFAVVKYNK